MRPWELPRWTLGAAQVDPESERADPNDNEVDSETASVDLLRMACTCDSGYAGNKCNRMRACSNYSHLVQHIFA